LNKNVTLE